MAVSGKPYFFFIVAWFHYFYGLCLHLVMLTFIFILEYAFRRFYLTFAHDTLGWFYHQSRLLPIILLRCVISTHISYWLLVKSLRMLCFMYLYLFLPSSSFLFGLFLHHHLFFIIPSFKLTLASELNLLLQFVTFLLHFFQNTRIFFLQGNSIIFWIAFFSIHFF